MKKLLAGSALLLLLSACAEKSALPPDEVMRKAALRSGLLQSVQFDGEGKLSATLPGAAGTVAVDFSLTGSTNGGGRMTHARVKTGGSIEDTTDHKLSLDAEVTAERGGSTYFFLHDVSSASPNPALPLDALIPFTGQWWRMPGKEGTSPVSVSPDPGLLAAQSQVITVTADKGINSIRGKRAYMYDIAVDPVRLLAYLKTMAKTNSQPFDEAAMKADLQTYTAIGKLWVDADSFDMERIEWDIRRVQDDKETLTATLHIDFTLHDSAPPIDVPATSRVFGAPPTGSAALLPVPSQSGGDDPTLLDVMQKAQQKAQKAASVSSF